MTTITLLDIVKQCRTMNTIRVQELGGTEDLLTLQQLYVSYTDVVWESFGREYTGYEIEYKKFYDKVLQRFEENY